MKTPLAYALVTAIIVGLAAPLPAVARDEIRQETIHFQKGSSGATVSGTLKGYETVDYRLRASAGQTMRVSLRTNNGANYFNVLPPGSSDEAIFVGSSSGNDFSGTLPATGDYTVRVYLMRNAARRNEAANYTIKVGITGAGHGAAHGAASGATQGGAYAGDAKVPGTDFHATGSIPCARSAGQPMTECQFGVTRERGASGMITVMWPDGGNRVIFYKNNTPSSYDQSEADGGARMTVDNDNGLFKVRIGDQRFEIFEAMMTGG